ncbi:MAG: anthranilate synthase component I family protein [Ichthyobacteriaceae bacterium]|nr:anthranilate synthase component I family protein [Ichthyobacteriaceae bacterium]
MIERDTINICLKNPNHTKQQLLKWGQKFNIFIILDSNKHNAKHSTFDFICATMPVSVLNIDNPKGAFNKLTEYQKKTNDWIFGHFTYDLKNDIENLSSNNYDNINFPSISFFQPEIIFFLKDNKLTVSFLKSLSEIEVSKILEEVFNIEINNNEDCNYNINIKSRITKAEYINKVESVKKHIKRGDIYELNFCQEYYAENAEINPIEKYKLLNKISTPPFASYYKLNNRYLLSASPERYILKKGNKVISQPIKGTAKRGKTIEDDNSIKQLLAVDKKEQAENVMIVDLVRNDLSHTAKRGTVKVTELCKVYTFQQVHQMISTIEAEVKDNISPIEIIKHTFPMGSMTGAPKISAMKLIEKYESTKRGIYSGSVGYFNPDGNFDFNVIIRSITYNANNKYLSFIVGSAITDKSNSENEYQETLIKADAMFKILKN